MLVPTCLLRRTYDPTALLAAHPPVLKHPHKRLVFDLACPPGAPHTGPIVVTRWAALALPATVELAATELIAMPGYYDYQGPSDGVWHVNFADPQLFVAYGSRLLAQDELQAAEHPILGSVREALVAEGQPAVTEEAAHPTPVLVQGAERRCAIDTTPNLDAGRLYGLYGNRFAQASADQVRGALRVLQPPTRSHLIAMAAPVGAGPYWPDQIARIVVTAVTGFAAAVAESRRAWPAAPVEVRTGFWGCGAFGGNRHAMTLLQLLAARLAGVDRVVFYASDDAGLDAYRTGVRHLTQILAAGTPGEPLAMLLERVADLDYQWGTSDGN
jgi:Poly (ADP-ribose) glycohydrolase (PARG)